MQFTTQTGMLSRMWILRTTARVLPQDMVTYSRYQAILPPDMERENRTFRLRTYPLSGSSYRAELIQLDQ